MGEGNFEGQRTNLLRAHSSCLLSYAYRKMIAVKMVFVRFSEGERGQSTNLGAAAAPRPPVPGNVPMIMTYLTRFVLLFRHAEKVS